MTTARDEGEAIMGTTTITTTTEMIMDIITATMPKSGLAVFSPQRQWKRF